MNTTARWVALGIGTTAGALGAYGAYQLQAAIDGPTSYLAVAAPVVAVSAALLPYLAEQAWRARQRVRAIALALAIVPAAAVVFFGAAERVHQSKAANEAERLAAHQVVTRAQANLADARAAAVAATLAANRVRGLNARQCGTRCLSVRETETTALARVGDAEAALRKAQGGAIAQATLTAPVWLLPAALDLIAFVAVWAGLGGVKPAAAKKPPVRRRRRPLARVKRQAPAPAKQLELLPPQQLELLAPPRVRA